MLPVHVELREGATCGLVFVRNAVPDDMTMMMCHKSVVSRLDSKIAVSPAIQRYDTKNYTLKLKHTLLFTERLC